MSIVLSWGSQESPMLKGLKYMNCFNVYRKEHWQSISELKAQRKFTTANVKSLTLMGVVMTCNNNKDKYHLPMMI